MEGRCWVVSRVGSREGMAGGEVARARHRELEAVDVEPLLVGVGQQPHEVVFLDALGGVVRVQVAAGGARVHALLQPLSLGVLLITSAKSLNVRIMTAYYMITRLGVDRVKPWSSVRISLGSG